jgi:hypothetical protein
MRVLRSCVYWILPFLCLLFPSVLDSQRPIIASVIAAALIVAAPNVLAQVSNSTPVTATSQSLPTTQAGSPAPGAPQVGTGNVTQPSPVPPANAIQKNQIGASSTVKDNLVVEAGLLTQASATQLFGGWIAEHFLVVQVTIGNQSREQQFVLQDIFLDYSNWKLSGIYGTPDAISLEDSRQLPSFQSGTKRGQISSIGALEMQEALKQNSVFSKRNFFVNGLVLIGTTAGGFTFLGPPGFTQGVAVYGSSFIPALQKFWPDRRIDQQSNVLKYGFQDKMVIAKEDPGKTYAFFPIERMLTRGLTQVYRSDPALFLNVSELYLDPNVWKNSHFRDLRDVINRLIFSQFAPGSFKCETKAAEGKKGSDCLDSSEFKAKVLADLFSPCYTGKETGCQVATTTSDNTIGPELREIRNVKDFVAGLSLNTVRVVVSGIMTVDVDMVPAVLTKIAFDDPGSGQKPIWEDTTSKHAGVIYGKYLANGNPVISGIKVPSDPSGTPADYFNMASLASLPDKSTDTELHFTVQFNKIVPPGATLTFQVAKSSSTSVNNAGIANTQETTTSMGLDYSVSYTPSATTPAVIDTAKTAISDIVFDSPADLLKAGQIEGHLVGSNLDGETIGIKTLTLSDGTAANLKTYLADDSPVNTAGSNSNTLNFTLSLKTGLPPGAKIVLDVTGKSADGSTQTVEAKPYDVPSK